MIYNRIAPLKDWHPTAALHQRNLEGGSAMPVDYKPAPCSHKELLELFDYDSTTGQFTRKIGSYCRYPKAVGVLHSSGYVFVCFPRSSKKIAAHRLAWFWVYGEWPPHDIDHINGGRADNRISNLRLATRSDNCRNMAPKRNKRGRLIGANFHKPTNKWAAQIRYGGKTHWLGVFDTEEQAHFAYLKAKAEHHDFQPIPRIVLHGAA